MTSASTKQLDANVDPGEIAKFEQLASRWWDPNSEFRPLHEINPLRLDFITSAHRLKESRYWMLAVVAAYWRKAWHSVVPALPESIWVKRRWPWQNCI